MTGGLVKKPSISSILAFSLVLATLVPFLPLAWSTWSGYGEDVGRVEAEIESTNRQIAALATRYLAGMEMRAREQALGVAVAASRLPDGPTALSWEMVDGSGMVTASQVAGDRVGLPCGYEGDLQSAGPAPAWTAVGRHIPSRPPTLLLARRLGPAGPWIAGVVDTTVLHSELTARSGAALDRHVYAIDGTGRLIFYSDPGVSLRGEDLKDNPPIRMHLDGREGPIRFMSIVSGKERLGHVQEVPGTGWGVIVSADIGARLIDLKDRYATLGWFIAFALLAAIGILLLTSRILVRPILEMRRAIAARDRPAAGPLDVSAGSRRITEYDDLARSFEDMAARFASVERELIHAEKAALLGQLASGIAHEIGTPLNVISGNAQYIMRKLGPDDPGRQALQKVLDQSERISGIIRRFLDFARPAESRRVPVDLGGVARQTLDMVSGMTRRLDLRVDIDPSTPRVLGDPKLLEHVLLNLVVNACQAMEDGGRLTLTVGAGSDPEDGREWVCCRVSDTGCGIRPEHTARVFDPFFSTKSADQGTGLGLAIVERIVRQHGGKVDFTTAVGRGTTFSVRLQPSVGKDCA